MQPVPPTIAARKRRTAFWAFSSCESNPLARLPAPRKTALRQAQRIIRRYFPSLLAAAGTTLPGTEKCSPASVVSGLCGSCSFPFFVDFASFTTLREVIFPAASYHDRLQDYSRERGNTPKSLLAGHKVSKRPRLPLEFGHFQKFTIRLLGRSSV
jgi:hypothetical protein